MNNTNTKTEKTENTVVDLFPISEYDKKEIREFQINHDNTAHPDFRDLYTYSFTPMPLGLLGSCKCEYCGQEHLFLSLYL